MSETSFLFEPNSAKLDQKFVVQGKALVLEAFNLPAGTKITFEKLLYKGSGPSMIRTGCCFEIAGKSVAVAARPYKLCDCTPELSNTSPMLVIDQEGIYNAIVTPASSAGLFYVQANEHVFAQVTDAMRGCCPVAGTGGGVSSGPITCAAIKAAFATALTEAHSPTTKAYGQNAAGECVLIKPEPDLEYVTTVGGQAAPTLLSGNVLITQLPAYPVVPPPIPAVPETTLTAVTSNTVKITPSGTAGHAVKADVIIDPVAGNALTESAAGLAVKIQCPAPATVATKLCPAGEFVAYNPATCKLEKYALPNHTGSFSECQPTVPLIVTGAQIDATNLAPALGQVVYTQEFAIADSSSAIFNSGAFNPFPIVSPSVALGANEILVLNLVSGLQVDINGSAVITSSLPGTLTLVSAQNFWRDNLTENVLKHEVFTFTPQSAGTFSFTVNGTYANSTGAYGAVRLSAVKVSASGSPLSLSGSTRWLGNAGDPADPGGFPPANGTGGGAQSLTIPGAAAGSSSLWLQAGRHLQVNSVDWSGGGVQILDAGGNQSVCTLSQSNAYSPSTSITILTHVNVGGAADDTYTYPNLTTMKDTAAGLAFTSSAPPLGASNSLTLSSNTICSATIVNPDLCKEGFVKAAISGGRIKATLAPNQGYDVSILTNTGKIFGPTSLVNFGTTIRTLVAPTPDATWIASSNLASLASETISYKYVITGNNHIAGQSSPVIEISPSTLILEVVNV